MSDPPTWREIDPDPLVEGGHDSLVGHPGHPRLGVVHDAQDLDGRLEVRLALVDHFHSLGRGVAFSQRGQRSVEVGQGQKDNFWTLF